MTLRKMFALVVALVLVVALFALPASAQTNSCAVHSYVILSSSTENVNPYYVDGCFYHSNRHPHLTQRVVTTYKCTKCGYTNTTTQNRGTYCPVGNTLV